MRKQPKHNQLYECARLFYIEKRKRKDIARSLGISATHVGRLLREAERKHIVRIELDFEGERRLLANQIKQKFNLNAVEVAESSANYDEIVNNLGKRAAMYFETFLQARRGATVGVGGGSSVMAMIDALASKPRGIDIVPLSLFGRGPQVNYVDSTFLATRLFFKCQPIAKAFVVGIPPLPRQEKKASDFLKMLLREVPEVSKVVEKAERADLACVGLGSLVPGDINIEYAKLGFPYQKLKEKRVVGAINYNYFDQQGKQVTKGLLTTSISALERMSSDPDKSVVLIAGGQHKVDSIRVAVINHMINVLITDEETARQLLNN